MEEADLSYPRVLVGGFKTISCTRAQLAHLMVQDCLEARQHSQSWKPQLVFSSNGQGLALAGRSKNFMHTMSKANIVHADGMPVVLASRMTWAPLPERISTTDFFHDAARAAEISGLRFFMLGASEAQNMAATAVIRQQYPRLKVVGRHHGYFGKNEDDAVCKMIRNSKADVVWIALGKPRQEQWCLDNQSKLVGVGWLKTCGGLYAFLSGDARRAPKWIQALSLEWLFRMVGNPRRLAWRYLSTNPYALYLLLRRTEKGRRPEVD